MSFKSDLINDGKIWNKEKEESENYYHSYLNRENSRLNVVVTKSKEGPKIYFILSFKSKLINYQGNKLKFYPKTYKLNPIHSINTIKDYSKKGYTDMLFTDSFDYKRMNKTISVFWELTNYNNIELHPAGEVFTPEPITLSDKELIALKDMIILYDEFLTIYNYQPKSFYIGNYPKPNNKYGAAPLICDIILRRSCGCHELFTIDIENPHIEYILHTEERRKCQNCYTKNVKTNYREFVPAVVGEARNFTFLVEQKCGHKVEKVINIREIGAYHSFDFIKKRNCEICDNEAELKKREAEVIRKEKQLSLKEAKIKALQKQLKQEIYSDYSDVEIEKEDEDYNDLPF